ncbi:uncharacterized protein LOC126978729 [Leptidea sinapis]|uniref:uncharacterized protein LOC126978729 n=1 Tax=Leptidea sinapis TaxID=189913 RepID=UPI0021334569|nr:uncharacterized protein LOC126978729 [Leptidea sinapis]
MQEKNDFEFKSIMSTWRRLSGEQEKSATLGSMSGDSSNHPTKIDEGAALLVPEKNAPVVITGLEVGAEAVSQETQTVMEKDNEKQEFLNSSGDFGRDTSIDSSKDKNEEELMEDDKAVTKPPDKEDKSEKDKVDSVYIGPRSSEKNRSTSSAEEEEDCGIKCLYYCLMCCDCVLM